MTDGATDLGGGLSLTWHVVPGYHEVAVAADWSDGVRMHRMMRKESIETIVKTYGGEQQWMKAMADWAREEQKKTMPPNSYPQQWMNVNNSSNWTASNATNFYQPTSPPPRWHNFPCGHQMELKPSQPTPMVCPTCGPVVMEIYTYQECGHPFSHQRGMAVPATCMTCADLVLKEKRAEEEVARLVAAEAKRREDEAKDPIAWLDRELAGVCMTL